MKSVDDHLFLLWSLCLCGEIRFSACGDGEGPGNAGANEPAPHADGRANAVRRADRSVYEHADDARRASADVRGPMVRADANGRGAR